MIITIAKRFSFEASHVLPKHPGKCSRLHGHSWRGLIEVSGPVDLETGFVLDFGELKKLVKTNIVDRCDHRHLGQGSIELTAYAVFDEDFYPTSEHLVMAFARILGPLVPEMQALVYLTAVELEETCTSRARVERSYDQARRGEWIG